MVRPPATGRSRGCPPCRKKRIKCDLGTPVCQRCIDARIHCPGPVSGVFFVVATAPGTLAAGTKKRGRRSSAAEKKKGSAAGRGAALTTNPSPEALFVDRDSTSGLALARSDGPAAQAPTVAGGALARRRTISPGPLAPSHPPQSPATTNTILLSTFIHYLSHSARRSSWTLALPTLSARPPTPLARPFQSALHAVALAHFANSTDDGVFERHARLEYSRALGLLRRALGVLLGMAGPGQGPGAGVGVGEARAKGLRRARAGHGAAFLAVFDRAASTSLSASTSPSSSSSSPQSPPATLPPLIDATRSALLASTLLSYYELIAATTPTAWIAHNAACEQLLALLGPTVVGSDRLLRQVAVSVRSHAVTRVVVYGHASIFGDGKWRHAVEKWTGRGHVPGMGERQSVSRDAYDWVVGFLLRFCRAGALSVQSPAGSPSSSSVAVEEAQSPAVGHDGEDTVPLGDELLRNYADWLAAVDPQYSAVSASSLPLFATPPSNAYAHGPAQGHVYGNGYGPVPLLSNTAPIELPAPLRAPFPAMALAYFHAAALLVRERARRAGGGKGAGERKGDVEGEGEWTGTGEGGGSLSVGTSWDGDAEWNYNYNYNCNWNCRWILGVCHFLQRSSGTNATAVLRMGLPFAVAWRCCGVGGGGGGQGAGGGGPEELDGAWMRATFEKWAGREGMVGLGVVAFPEREPAGVGGGGVDGGW